MIEIIGDRRSGKTTALVALAVAAWEAGDRPVFIVAEAAMARGLERRFTEAAWLRTSPDWRAKAPRPGFVVADSDLLDKFFAGNEGRWKIQGFVDELQMIQCIPEHVWGVVRAVTINRRNRR